MNFEKIKNAANVTFTFEKEATAASMLERGFYQGVGACVGLIAITAAPEILVATTAVVAGVVVYRGINRAIKGSN